MSNMVFQALSHLLRGRHTAPGETAIKPLVFYELDSLAPGRSMSPFCFKVRFAMNYKHIPFTPVFIPHHLIESKAKEVGADPTGTKPDGSPLYTVPFIDDPNKGKIVSDSTPILRYLDSAYPDTPTVNPEGTETLQRAFRDFWMSTINGPFLVLVVPSCYKKLEPKAQEHMKPIWGPLLDETEEKTQAGWTDFQRGLDQIDGWMEKDQLFIAGDKPIDVDFMIGSFFAFAKTALGEDSDAWKKMTSLNNGRWRNILEQLEKY